MPGKSCTAEEIFRRVSGALPDGFERLPEFPCVAAGAMPFFAALLAWKRRTRAWIAMETPRSQEEFSGELALWAPATAAFPHLPTFASGEEILPDPELEAERFGILSKLADPAFHGPVVLSRSQWDEQAPDPVGLRRRMLRLKRGDRSDPQDLVRELSGAGYEQTPLTASRGQFSLRGGIVDVFPRQGQRPWRVEFDDDLIASLREYDPDTQLSVGEADAVEILLGSGTASGEPATTLRKLVGVGDLVIDDGESAVRLLEGGDGLPGIFDAPFSALSAGDLVLDAVRAGAFFDQLGEWRENGWQVVLGAGSEGEAKRFQEFGAERGQDLSWVEVLSLPLSAGFVFPAARLAVLADAALFGRAAALRASRAATRHHRVAAARAATDFSDFAEGDYVVHLEHGIGIFEGIGAAPDAPGQEVMVLRYAAGAKLYVPLDQAWQVSRYAGLGRARPALHELGSPSWSRAKEKATRSVFDYAARMLRVQAERQSLAGHASGPDTHWQAEFEDAFPHRPTADQIRAIRETKADMQSTRPMDRLICGDVGFGKTEVAIRAAFKAVMGGRQVAFLAPTTVLARQHFHTLRERMSDYPVNVELLSRYRSPGEQRRVIEGLASGAVDIVAGTHRLVSPDVVFRELGLVVVDEEQRFGVKQKDLLKERFRQVDVLTLSATPIPRTLYLALSGARDMSLIETPPPNRRAVETVVCAYDERIWREAVLRELERGGQVYFLHNRVRTIERVASRVQELCPGARVVIGHGQMADAELEPVMSAFVAGKADVLVSTTIIESGLDIPNANTIVIDRADMFGLADLYQLRGRVGRSATKAYAYLMLPRDLMGAARKRVSAIKQYSELGSGFKIAMRDLELRGAGNLLGTAQSGHILAVGFDLYCRMLRRAVDALSGEGRFTRRECAVRLDFVERREAPPDGRAPAFLPASYVPDTRTRIACYRQLAEADSSEALDKIESSWRDRFGAVPAPARNLLLLSRIAAAGCARGIVSIEAVGGQLRMRLRGGAFVQPGGRFPRLTSPDPTSRVSEVLTLVQNQPQA